MPSNDTHLFGRPYGSLAIAHRTKVIRLINDYGVSITNHVQGLSVEIGSKRFLLLYVYFPYKSNNNYDVEVLLMCAFMSTLVNVDNNCNIIIAGNFNFDIRNLDNCDNMDAFLEILSVIILSLAPLVI